MEQIISDYEITSIKSFKLDLQDVFQQKMNKTLGPSRNNTISKVPPFFPPFVKRLFFPTAMAFFAAFCIRTQNGFSDHRAEAFQGSSDFQWWSIAHTVITKYRRARMCWNPCLIHTWSIWVLYRVYPMIFWYCLGLGTVCYLHLPTTYYKNEKHHHQRSHLPTVPHTRSLAPKVSNSCNPNRKVVCQSYRGLVSGFKAVRIIYIYINTIEATNKQRS